MTFLKIANISKTIDDRQVLKKINFSQSKGRRIALAGETGSGKSTLLKIIAGLVQPDHGEVWFKGERVEGPEEKLVAGHPSIAYLSQHFELQKFLRVEQILTYASHISDKKAAEIIKISQIDHLLERRSDQLSGGERQRTALAKLLLGSPDLLLLDEPFSNLDLLHKNTLKQVIDDISGTMDITCILVSHDPADMLSWAEEIVVLKNGILVQKGSPYDMYYQPKDEYVAGLSGKYNLLKEDIIKNISGHERMHRMGKVVLIRPEQFSIVKKGKRTLPASIRKITFTGGHYEILTVLDSGEELTIRSDMPALDKNDQVWITLK